MFHKLQYWGQTTVSDELNALSILGLIGARGARNLLALPSHTYANAAIIIKGCFFATRDCHAWSSYSCGLGYTETSKFAFINAKVKFRKELPARRSRAPITSLRDFAVIQAQEIILNIIDQMSDARDQQPLIDEGSLDSTR